MGVLILFGTLVLAWILALFNVNAPGTASDPTFWTNAICWMFFLPAGIQFLVSGFMHTALAKKTAASIGWVTNGFQYEIGFVSLGLGVAGLVATTLSRDAWLVLTIVISFFLILAAAQHIKQMVAEKNFAPGNSLILLYDIGLPVSLWICLLAG